MAYNNIPLALGYDGDTGNASGLVEFTLSSTDLGDICSTAPDYGQVLVWSSTGVYCPSTLPPPGSFTGNLSDVGQVCSATPENGQALVWSSAGSIWCPSTVGTGGGGGSLPTGAKDTLLWNGSEGINWAASAPSDVGIVKEEYENVFTQTNTFQAAPIIQTATEHTYATIGAASALSSIVSPGANSLLAYGAGNTPEAIASTDHMLTFLGTSADLSSCRDVSSSTFATDGNNAVLVWDATLQAWKAGHFDGAITFSYLGGKSLIDFNRFLSFPDSVTGKGDLSTGFVYVSGTSSTQSTTYYASDFGKNWLSGNPSIQDAGGDSFIYLSGNSGETIAATDLNSDAKDFIQYGNAGAGQLDHGALGGLGDNDHPQYLLSGAAITDHGALAGLGDDDHPQYRLSATLITNAGLATMAAATVKGSVGGGTPADLSMTQLQSITKTTLRAGFHLDAQGSCQLGAHPQAEEFLKNSSSNMQIADLSTYSQVRLFCRIITNSASSRSPRLIAKYHTSYTTTLGTFSDLGTSEVATSLASYTLANSGWINLDADAKIDDCYITITQIGGDSVATPRVGSLVMEFR